MTKKYSIFNAIFIHIIIMSTNNIRFLMKTTGFEMPSILLLWGDLLVKAVQFLKNESGLIKYPKELIYRKQNIQN